MELVKQKSSFRSEAGQILLVVVLVVIVVTTVGLSLASRSITSLRTSTEEAESQKALAAAEAGVERLLENSAPTTEGTIGGTLANANYSAYVHQLSATTFLMNGGNSVPKDEGADLWFTVYSSDKDWTKRYISPLGGWNGTLHVYWGTDSSNPCNNPALEIIIVTGTAGNPVSKRYTYDPCLARQSENHFGLPSPSGGMSLPYGSDGIDVVGGLIARVIPLYGSTIVGVDGGNTALPLQGFFINSTGTSGQTSRKIRVFKGYPQTYLPYLSYGLFVAADK
jgi:hypothetical protein